MRFKYFLIENSSLIHLDGKCVKVKGKEVGSLSQKDGKILFSNRTGGKEEFDSLQDFYEYIIQKFKLKVGTEYANFS